MTSAVRRSLWGLALVWVVGLHTGLFWIERDPEPRRLWGDEHRYLRGARSLAAGESWNPDPPLWSAGYARFLAPLIGSEGNGRGGGARWPVEVVQLGLLVFSALLLRGVGRSLLGDPAAGEPGLAPDLAAWGLLAYPPLAAFTHYLWPEVLHLTLLLLIIWLLVDGRRGLGWLVLLGVSAGLALAVKSLLLPLVPLLLLVLAREGGWRVGWPRAAVVLGAMALVLLPAAWSSLRQHGELPGRSTALLNLWVGINDTSPTNLVDSVVEREMRAYRDSAPDSRGRAEWLERRIGERVREIGPWPLLTAQLTRQYRRFLDKDSFLTDQLPGGVLESRRVGYRQAPGWISASLRWSSYLLWAAVLLLAPLGFVAYRPRGLASWRWLPLLLVGYHLALFLLLHVKTRYRLQIVPLLILAAAAGWSYLAERRRRRETADARLSGLALALSGGVAGLLLFLAFGP